MKSMTLYHIIYNNVRSVIVLVVQWVFLKELEQNLAAALFHSELDYVDLLHMHGCGHCVQAHGALRIVKCCKAHLQHITALYVPGLNGCP